MPIEIDSNKPIPIEQHFRVSAGPGAGKTYWLINHIKNVLHNSERLGKSRKIACITYTNIAVEIIINRLGESAGQVEVSTIHSFLYNYVVKPYVGFISEDYDINANKIDGHDEHLVSFKFVKEWIQNHPNRTKLRHPYTIKQLTKRPECIEALRKWLSSYHYEFNNKEELEAFATNKEAYYHDNNKRQHLSKKKCLEILGKDLLSCKKEYWKRGILHHEDILFISHQLIVKFPFIPKVLRAKFPYFFVDEFQDTNPIQTKILEMIGQEETIVGVIGDKAQSIFEFQGAKPEQFDGFTLPRIVDYQMPENRRSSKQIIEFLNEIRCDIRQKSEYSTNGSPPLIIAGDMIKALAKAKELCDENDVCSLSWDNITSNAMKRTLDIRIPNRDLFEVLYSEDSNSERSKIISSSVKAVELSRQKRFKEAIKEMEKNYSKKTKDREVRRKNALRSIMILLSFYNQYAEKSLYDFWKIIIQNVEKTKKLNKGKAKTFYESHTYQQLAVCVKITEDKSLNRTVHKAKGAEFDNVLLILKKSDCLKCILEPDFDNKEEHRIYYVAMSRAKKRLFISVPELPNDKIVEGFNSKGVEFINV